jgi:hypothetical protein
LQSGDGAAAKSAAITFVSGFCGPYAPACNGAGQAALASAYGASDEDAWKIGARAAIETYLNKNSNGTTSFSGRLINGCLSSVINGGNCGDGMKSSAINYAVGRLIGDVNDDDGYGWAQKVALRAGIRCMGAAAGGGQCGDAARSSVIGDVQQSALAHIDQFTFGGIDTVFAKSGVAFWVAEASGKNPFSAAYLAGGNELTYQLDVRYGFSKYANEKANIVLNAARLEVANVVQTASTWVGTKDYSADLPKVGSQEAIEKNAEWLTDGRKWFKSKLPL